jgi:S-adenosyl-L-methionine hydrolase (adenosine-forming)
VHTITLTTDFGTRDWFIGAMKGVVLGINPRAVTVDLTHEIPPGDIRAGAFTLMAGYDCFPKGTVHVVVVDPGVGSQRRAIAAQTANYLFVGPDNGVLSWALAREKIKAIRLLENPKYFLGTISHTFHGRDIFAPTAAHLSCGVSLKQFGRKLNDVVRFPWPKPTKQRNEIRGEIVYIDRFGNAITNLQAGLIPNGRKIICGAIGKQKVRCALALFYGAVPANSPVAVMGSSGFLEIAVNGGSAARQFGLTIGDAVIVRPS